MSGHNKWSKIKRQKGLTDAKKSKVFTKLARLIYVEVKKANGNVDSSGVQFAVRQAKDANMPSDNIERAIKKGSSNDSENLESIIYESYGPGGVAIIIEAMTSNRNKAASEIKHILTTHNSQLAGIGSVLWAFEKIDGQWTPKTTVEITDEKDGETLDSLIDDLEENDEVQAVYTNAQ